MVAANKIKLIKQQIVLFVSLFFITLNSQSYAGTTCSFTGTWVTTEQSETFVDWEFKQNGDLLRAVCLSEKYKIYGTNPGASKINQMLVNDPIAQQIICHESAYKQFDAARENGEGLPLVAKVHGVSEGGIGVMQLYNPPASDNAIWGWQQNIAEGLELLNEKRKLAAEWPEIEHEKLNLERKALGLPNCPEGIPTALTSEQLTRESIREYNCGHEYHWEPIDAPNCAGQWIQKMSPGCTDTGYVDKVLSCHIIDGGALSNA